MPDRKKGIMLSLFTCQGPLVVRFSLGRFEEFVKMVNTLLADAKKETPIPKVFEDAFKKEE